MAYVGALDQGTSSTRFVIFDQKGQITASAQEEHEQIYPRPGWVEQRAEEIWSNSVRVMQTAMARANLEAKDLASIGITNQRETTVVWDKETGEPVHNAVVWNCGRTSGIVREMQAKLGGVDALREITGYVFFKKIILNDVFRVIRSRYLTKVPCFSPFVFFCASFRRCYYFLDSLPISTYFAGTKLRWLLNEVPGLEERAKNGEVLFGTIDCWLIWKFTNGDVHATDVTNASRTLLVDVGTLQWDDRLLEIFDIPKSILPTIQPSLGGQFGAISSPSCSAFQGIPIGAILGDQHAATFGQACFTVGDAKCTFGTGAFMFMNVGLADPTTRRPVVSKQGLMTTPFYQAAGEPPVYALEGAVAYAGSLIQWLRDNIQFGESAVEIAKLAASVPDAQGVRFVPAFNGLFAPHWRDDARGIIVGLTAFHTRAHIARAAIDSTCFQTTEVFDAMEKDSGVALSELRVDGGMTANPQLLQFTADLLETKVLLPKILETTALGVAFAAGLAQGVWKSQEEIKELWTVDKTVEPDMSEEERAELKQSWSKAIGRSVGWED